MSRVVLLTLIYDEDREDKEWLKIPGLYPTPLPPSSNCFQFENNLAVGHKLPPFPVPVGISAFRPEGVV